MINNKKEWPYWLLLGLFSYCFSAYSDAEEVIFEGDGSSSSQQAFNNCQRFESNPYGNLLAPIFSPCFATVDLGNRTGYHPLFIIRRSRHRTISYSASSPAPDFLSNPLISTNISTSDFTDQRGNPRIRVNYTAHSYSAERQASAANNCSAFYNAGCRLIEEYRYYYGFSCASQGLVFFEGQCVQQTISQNNNGDSDHNTCNPINIATGNKFFNQQDFIGRGVNPLRLSLFYNSNNSTTIWTHDYQQHLIIDSETIQAHRANGQMLFFTLNNGVINGQSQRSEYLRQEGNTYELGSPNNTVETYDSDGQLLAIRYPSGIVHRLSYPDSQTMEIERNNNRIRLQTSHGQLTQATLPDQSTIAYQYDQSNNVSRLLSVAYEDGEVLNYHYDDARFPLAITGITDENGNRISTVVYDDQGRAISSEVGSLDSGIDRTQITYHEDGSRTLTNALGKQNTYHFTDFNGEFKMTEVEGHASENCAAANQSYTYDANGFMASKTDWKGNTTTYINNERGLETSRIEAAGTTDARTITTEWHPTFNLRTRITEPDRITVLVYDDQGRMISQEVSPR